MFSSMSKTHAIHVIMNIDNGVIKGIDLNLLVSLRALIHHKSVTLAAKEMAVTQSAMSHTLRRLRSTFDDPLLVRGKDGYLLSARAEHLWPALQTTLNSVMKVLEKPEVFRPETSRRCYRVCAPDLFDVLMLPKLLRSIHSQAPGIDVAVVPRPKHIEEALESGALDIAIQPVTRGGGSFGVELMADLRQQRLLRDHFVCFASNTHPELSGKKRLTLRKFCKLPHILVSPGGGRRSVIDEKLLALGEERRVALQVPSFSTAVRFVNGSDYLLTGPSSLAALLPTARTRPVPFDFPDHSLVMLWHAKVTKDPGHEWLRTQLLERTR